MLYDKDTFFFDSDGSSENEIRFSSGSSDEAGEPDSEQEFYARHSRPHP